ncbi:MAG: hypothetical protein IJD08_02640, partial [Oscillospiraceae bacterium]|nr:hypothetical protein [Oscillospiraceae bacterium]
PEIKVLLLFLFRVILITIPTTDTSSVKKASAQRRLFCCSKSAPSDEGAVTAGDGGEKSNSIKFSR